jgi:hypothetical protein
MQTCHIYNELRLLNNLLVPGSCDKTSQHKHPPHAWRQQSEHSATSGKSTGVWHLGQRGRHHTLASCLIWDLPAAPHTLQARAKSAVHWHRTSLHLKHQQFKSEECQHRPFRLRLQVATDNC